MLLTALVFGSLDLTAASVIISHPVRLFYTFHLKIIILLNPFIVGIEQLYVAARPLQAAASHAAPGAFAIPGNKKTFESSKDAASGFLFIEF